MLMYFLCKNNCFQKPNFIKSSICFTYLQILLISVLIEDNTSHICFYIQSVVIYALVEVYWRYYGLTDMQLEKEECFCILFR